MSNKYIVKVNNINVEVSKEVYELVEVFNNELTLVQQDNRHLLDLQKSMDKQYEELEKENQQLKERLKHHNEIVEYSYDLMLQKDKYKSVLDEIREYMENGCLEEKELSLTCIDTNKIKQILDKVKE